MTFLLINLKPILLYADPGAGALILQMIMAAVVGGLFYFRKLRYKLFGKNAPSTAKSDSAGASQPDSEEAKK